MELVTFSTGPQDARTLVKFSEGALGTVLYIDQAALVTPALWYTAAGTPQCFKPTKRGTTNGH